MLTCILELPQPVVKMVSIGSSIAGEPHSLKCSVETEAGVRPGDISISWTTPNGSASSEALTSDLTSERTVIRSRLNLSALATSEAGSYTCTGTIAAESVGVSVSNQSSLNLSVTSKPSCFTSIIVNLSLFFCLSQCQLQRCQ